MEGGAERSRAFVRLRLMLDIREDDEELVEAAVLFVRTGASLEPEASEATECCRGWVQMLGRAAACDAELEAVIGSEKERQQWGSAGLT